MISRREADPYLSALRSAAQGLRRLDYAAGEALERARYNVYLALDVQDAMAAHRWILALTAAAAAADAYAAAAPRGREGIMAGRLAAVIRSAVEALERGIGEETGA